MMRSLEKYIYLKDLVADCRGIDKIKFVCYTIFTKKEKE